MKIWQWLGYLGLIPFIVCIFLPELISETLGVTAKKAFIYYSVIILSFLSGTLWKVPSGAITNRPYLASNFICLFAYLCLFLSIKLSLILLPLGYMVLLIAEYYAYKQSFKYPLIYYNFRVFLTIFVVILHAIMLIF
ncbi:MAG: DUF3429 domain-containing protein [Colwellia sp.]